MTLDDEISGAITAVANCIDRLRAVNAMRLGEGKAIAPGRVTDALRLRAGLDQLIREMPAPADQVSEILGELREKVL